MTKKVWTITFGEVAENHAGMQTIGDKKTTGFSVSRLKKIKKLCTKLGYVCELIKLEKYLPKKYRNDDTDARVLVIRDGIKMLLGGSKSKFKRLEEEIEDLDDIVDKKAYMYGRVVNKYARYNLCFGEKSQKPNYEKKKGRIVAFKDVKYLNKIRNILPNFFGKKAKNLLAELNYYYDAKKCFIGEHGDTERSRVIALRFGTSMPLYYRWFHAGKPISERVKIKLNGGDLYIMSEKAVGTDWKKKNISTLRHSTGSKKALKID